MIIPSHPYWPLTPGSWIRYQVFEIEGGFVPATKQLGISAQRECPVNGVQIWKCVRLPMRMPVVAVVTTLPGEPEPTPANMDALFSRQYILNGRWRSGDGTQDWFGEAGPLFPFQPLLTANPVMGEEFRLTSDNRGFTEDGITDPTGKLIVDYRTMYHGPWAGWNDCIMTAMVENPDRPGFIAPYNYVWARGIGPVDQWHGVIDADNKIVPGTGYRWYATAWGGQ